MIPDEIQEQVDDAVRATGGLVYRAEDAPIMFDPYDVTPLQSMVMKQWGSWGIHSTPSISMLTGWWDGASFLCRVPTGRRVVVPGMAIVGRSSDFAPEVVARAWVGYFWAHVAQMKFREDWHAST